MAREWGWEREMVDVLREVVGSEVEVIRVLITKDKTLVMMINNCVFVMCCAEEG